VHDQPSGAVVPRSEKSYAAQLPSLTGLRWVAAFLVFGFHLHVEQIYRDGRAADLLSFFFAPGPVGVSFFFILSGFVLAWSARANDTTRAFWRRRAAKLLPNHLVTWAIVLAALLVLSRGVTGAEAGLNASLLQAWVPDESIYFGINTPSWSLSCEAFFYALFPLLWLRLSKAGTRTLTMTAAAMLVLIWLVPTLGLLMSNDMGYWFVWIFPVARLPEFVLGICAARLVAEGKRPRVGMWQASLLVLAMYVAAPHLGRFGFVAVTALPLVLLIAATATRDIVGAPSVWRAKTLVVLGGWSYAFYLVHQIVIRFGAGTHQSPLVGTLWAVALLAAAIGSAAALHRFVEAPAMRRFSKARPARPRIPLEPRGAEST
jgi:peptidoglycan/LPS O-acetylase OafA/YrhL